MSKRDSVIQQNIAFMYGRNTETEKFDPDKRLLVKSKPKFVDADAVTSFTGDYSFLSPHFLCEVCCIQDEIDQGSYPSFEHALQASKVTDPAIREEIRRTPGIRDIKRLAAKSTDGWKDICLSVAEKLLRDKFMRNKGLKAKLSETKSGSLVYRNDFGDLFWGVGADGKGQNNLGKLMEAVRRDIQSGNDTEKWLESQFNCVVPDSADIFMEIKKGDQAIAADSKTFQKTSRLTIGKSDECDVVTAHPSISRIHAVFLIDNRLGPVLVDLGSSNGTWVDREALKSCGVVRLQQSSLVRFGSSGRTYRFIADTNANEKRKADLYEKLSDPKAFHDIEEETERTVFVRNIDPDASDADIESFFAQCGAIQKLSVPRDKVTKQLKGIAFVTFRSLSGLVQALSRDKDMLLTQELRIKKNTPKPPGDMGGGGGAPSGRVSAGASFSSAGEAMTSYGNRREVCYKY